MADNDVFSSDPVEIDLSFNDVVGEDKKYKDPDALAKGYANIERHARTLEAENARVRAELEAVQATTKLGNNSEPPRQEQPPAQDPAPVTPNSTPKSEDFRSQIKEEIRALNEQDRAVQNIETTARKLVDTFGSQAAANEAVRTRAHELGVSVEWLRDSAATSPSAFYATMNIPVSGVDRSTPAPNQEVRFTDNRNVKNFEHYDRLRKENSKLYYSAATQREMLNAARAQGADFYKR